VIPAVPLPGGSTVRTPIDVKLKRTWRFDKNRRVFLATAGETFEPWPTLPRGSRIVYKVPKLAEAVDPSRLSKPERDLARYMHVILPKGKSPADWVEAVRAWPPVEEANVAPDVSLPSL
jgi:hypothetical protein